MLALVVHRLPVAAGFWRAAFFTPFVVSVAASSVVWVWILQPEFGIVNYLLQRLGLPPSRWTEHPGQALWVVVLVSVWRQMGYEMVLFLAGLKHIHPAYLEAAAIDGAGGWTRFWRITLPLLGPTLSFALLTLIIDSAQVFAQVDLMTRGGPLGGTTVLVYLLFREAFEYFQMGRASAVAVMMDVALLGFTVLWTRRVDRRVFYR